MGALGLFIKTLIAFIDFIRENNKYSDTIPKNVLFWCAIVSLFTNVYQYNTIIAGNKDITTKDKLITELQHSKANMIVDTALVNEVKNLKQLLTQCNVPKPSVSTPNYNSYNRYQQLQHQDHH